MYLQVAAHETTARNTKIPNALTLQTWVAEGKKKSQVLRLFLILMEINLTLAFLECRNLTLTLHTRKLLVC
jgi:hypothetical protein